MRGAYLAAAACLWRRHPSVPLLPPASRTLQLYFESRVMNTIIEQTPDEVLDWAMDWSTRGLSGDTIAGSVWAASSEDFTLSGDAVSGTMVTVWLTGGVPGKMYSITNTITTSGGRTLQETVRYICIPQRLVGNVYD